MKPTVHAYDAKSFDTLGFGAIQEAISCNVIEEINGNYELHLTMLASDKQFRNIRIGSIIAVKANLTDKKQAFVIETISKNIDGVVEVYATHISQHRAKLIPVDPYTSISLSDALEKIMTNSREDNPFTLSTNKQSSAQQKLVVPLSMREILGGHEGSLLDVYGGEYNFNNFDIQLLQRRGKETNVRILYGVNMIQLDVDDEFSFNASITGILPYWYSEEKGLVKGNIQYTSNAETIGYKKTVPVDFSQDFETKPTVAQLNSKAQSYLNSRGLPTRNIQVSFEQIQQLSTGDNLKSVQNLQLGDTVTVIFSEYDLNYQSRIIATDFDVLLERYNSMTIGDKKTNINDAIGDTISNTLSNIDVISSNVSYSNASSGLSANTVQGAIDEIDSKLDEVGRTYSKNFTDITLLNDSYTNIGVLENIPKGTYLVISLVQFGSGVNGVRRTITYNNSETMPSFSRYNGATMQPLSNGVSMLQFTRVWTLSEDNNSIGLGGYQSNGSAMSGCYGMIYATRIA